MMQITPRERWLALGLTVAVALWTLYALAVRPAQERIGVLERVVPEKQAQLQDLAAQSAQYTALRDECARARAQMAAQQPDFDVTRFLEGLIDRHQLARHVVTMSPDTVGPRPDYSETVVTIELHDISLKELVDFLTEVESSASLARIGTLHIRTDPHSETQLDSTIGICSPQLGPSALATQTSP